MTLQIGIEGIKNCLQTYENIYLQVKGSRSGFLMSPPLPSISTKWKPRFKIDCSKSDKLEFYLYSLNEDNQTDIGFGRLGIEGFIRREGEDLDISKPQKFLLDLMLEDHPNVLLEMWITYNPYQLFQGQFCEKVSLNMKTKGYYPKRKQIEQKSEGKHEDIQIMSAIFQNNRVEDGRTFKSEMKNQQLSRGELGSRDKQNVEQENKGKKFIGNQRSERRGSQREEQKRENDEEFERASKLLNEQTKNPEDKGSERPKRQSQKMEGQVKYAERTDINFYLGKCQTVNAFSCLDDSVKGQQFSFTELPYKRRK